VAHTTGSGLFADGPQPSAKSGLPSAKALPMAIRRGRRQRAIGRHFFGKGRFADGQLSGHRQSFADGHISNRQRRHVSRRAVRLTAALPTADAAWPSAKRFLFFFGISMATATVVGKLFLPTAGHRQSYGHFADGLGSRRQTWDLLTSNLRFADGWPSANLGIFFLSFSVLLAFPRHFNTYITYIAYDPHI